MLFRPGPAPYRLIAAPIELKSGTVDASEVAGQLQQGIEFVKRFAPPDAQLNMPPDPDSRPVLQRWTAQVRAHYYGEARG